MPALVLGPVGPVWICAWFDGSTLLVSGFGMARMMSGEEFRDGDDAESVVPPPMNMACSDGESR